MQDDKKRLGLDVVNEEKLQAHLIKAQEEK